MGSSRRADLTADLFKRGVVLSLFPPPLFFSFVFLALLTLLQLTLVRRYLLNLLGMSRGFIS